MMIDESVLQTTSLDVVLLVCVDLQHLEEPEVHLSKAVE